MSDSKRFQQQDAESRQEAADPKLSSARKDDLPGDGEVIQPSDFTPLHGPVKRKRRGLRPLHFYLAGAFAVLVLLAAFLFTARSVFVRGEPEDARVAIDGGLYLPVGDGYLMLGGEYDIELTAAGYHPLRDTVHIGEEQNQTYRYSLDKLPGHLTVSARTGSGEVWIDGRPRGTLNETISEIPAGPHELQIVSERHKPFTRRIEITGLDQHQNLAVELEPAWADVSFSTSPPGAELRVDGEAVGKTPLTAEILEGERRVALKLPGHKTWQDVLDVEAGEVIYVPEVELQKADGLVRVESTPAQASVTVDGNYYGLTPTEVALPPGESYEITLFKDGFKPAREQVNVESGREQSIKLKLQANLGQISVNTSPQDALLYVNGRLMGRANQTLNLPAHQTTIAIKKEGYADYETTLLPRPNFDQSVDIELKTLEEAKWETIPTRITTEAGQSLQLFRPEATFSMGSSRREQGRRANEAMHKVALTRPFYLGTHEVTNQQFRQFRRQHSSGHAKGESLNGQGYPAVQVSWQEAALYCNWLSEQEGLPLFYQVEDGAVAGFNPQSTGYRLATEAEWAWAARYRDGEMLKYPWGPQLPPQDKVANIADRNAAPLVGYVQPAYDDGYAASAPVGSFPANDKGIFDLTGNVAEWVNDFYEISVSLSQKANKDPIGPTEGSYHVIRGSSWAHGGVTELRLSFRDYGEEGRNDLGFRIARFVD